MATYDYSAYDPQVGQSDYPIKISNLITQLGTDVTSESNRLDGVKTKTDLITITQAVNLDTMETDISVNNAKVTNATHTGDVTGDTALTIANDSVTYAKMQNAIADSIILGNNAGVGTDIQELTVANVITLLNTGTGLDADTLDNINSTDFARISVDNTYTGRQNFQDYSEKAISVTVSTPATMTIDTSLGTYFYLSATLGANAYTFAFSNPAATGQVTSFTLELAGAGNATSITWPTSVLWPNGDTEPTWSTFTDLVTFFTRSNGTAWFGVPGGFTY